MTYFFKDDRYEIVGHYEIIGRIKLEYNDGLNEKDNWKNWDLLVLYNLEDKGTEVKYCPKKQ